MRKFLTAGLTLGLLFGAVASVGAAPKPVTVFKDGAGDADVGQGAGQSVPAGWDLASGSIAKNGANLEFTVAHHDMPPVGSAPEMSRFLWNFTVDGEHYRLTVKSADIGKPDVVGGQTTERVGRADVAGHFRLEGECATDSSLPVGRVNCPVIGYVEGAFDPAAMSFTVLVPMEMIKAKTGSAVGPGAANICTICWVSQVAERSLNNTIIDAAAQAVVYKVPKK